MKWLREISTQYIPGVEFDGESVNFRNSNLSWDEDFFTILPLTDGTLIIQAYGSSAASDRTLSPGNNIQISYRLRGEDTWTDYTFAPKPSGHGGVTIQGYITKNISLTAGVPIELKCSTGLARKKTEGINSAEVIFPGNIKTTCPAIIMGQLESLAVGGVNTSGTYGPELSMEIPWSNYLFGLRELFEGWDTLLDATNLVMPNVFDASSTTPDLTGLFSGCSNLALSPIIFNGGTYVECFKDCVSLRSVYADLHPGSRVSYTLTDWLKGTNSGQRVIYVPDTLNTSYDLCLPESWTREIFEF